MASNASWAILNTYLVWVHYRVHASSTRRFVRPLPLLLAHATTHEYCILYGPVSCSIIIYCPVVCTRGHVSTFHFRLSLDNSAEYNIIIWQLTPAPAAQQWPHNSRVLTSWMHLCVVVNYYSLSLSRRLGWEQLPHPPIHQLHTHDANATRCESEESLLRGYNLWATLFWRQWLKVLRRAPQESTTASCSSLGATKTCVCDNKSFGIP